MKDYFEEFVEGQIQLRDKYQFELKSEYRLITSLDDASYTTEFYLFIPNSLQIHPDTYSKKQFYKDETSLIRYKSPLISLEELAESSLLSPLVILENEVREKKSLSKSEALFELKLFANILRGRLRDRTLELIKEGSSSQSLNEEILKLLALLERVEKHFYDLKSLFRDSNRFETLETDWDYLEEFISVNIEYYLTNLLEFIRKSKHVSLEESDLALSKKIADCQEFRMDRCLGTPFSKESPHDSAREFYRMSLLNKYVSEVLFLQVKRQEPKRHFREISAMMAAGIAMFVYLLLLSTGGPEAIIDSTAFIVLAVILYVLKDRLKEGIRNWSTKIASKLYPDYVTKIYPPQNGAQIGKVSEYFSFLNRAQVPHEVQLIRDNEFHDDLEKIKRNDSVIYYKKKVQFYPEAVKEHKRLHHVHDIFRYNLVQFLFKAKDPSIEYPHLNHETDVLEHLICPKIYHVNIILKRTFNKKSGDSQGEFDKFRIFLDKEGIRSIERL